MPHQPLADTKREFARKLRREMTEAEARLWQESRGRRLDRIKFRRQVPIGIYVADFACLEAKLIVQIDGSQHAGSMRDQTRDADLKARGFRVLRDVNSVCDTIIAYVQDTSLQPWR